MKNINSKKNDSRYLKQFLRDKCLPLLAEKHTYFNIRDIRAYLALNGWKTCPATLKIYLSELASEPYIYHAGKGWYTFVKTPFILDKEPVEELIKLLKNKYPLLKFSCWSTAQIRSYAHHLLNRFVHFVYVESDAMPSVAEFLRDKGYDVWKNPRGLTAKEFSIREKTLVIRRTLNRQPGEDFFSPIEKILVDLFAENRSIPLTELEEYSRIFRNIAERERLSMGALLSYARERKLKKTDFEKTMLYTISAF